MEYTVLVPSVARGLFRQGSLPDVNPVYYRPGSETVTQRLLRKFGLRDMRQTLLVRVNVEENMDLLDNTIALWLSPAVYLSSPLMVELLDRLPNLKWVYSQLTGTEHLDLEIFRKRKVMISNAGTLHSRRTAEMVLACMFSHAKKLPVHIALQKKRKWRSLLIDDLHHQRVGIVGTGNIGREVATCCRAIGMHVAGASRNPDRFGQDPSPYDHVVSLHKDLGSLLAEVDHVVIALPLNQDTRGLIGRSELRKMKKDASLINIARAGIVDEFELCQALTAARIGAAYIDRPSRVPPPFWNRLYRTRNLILTHNSSANSPNVQMEAFGQFMRGLRGIIETGQPPNRVA